MAQHERGTAYYHLPGLFEFYELYRVFLPLFREHREYFYDWCEIGSVYGAPADCIWGGGRTGFGDAQPHRVLALMQEYGISARLTFSNSLLREEHLADRKCNALCALFEKENRVQNGVIVHSDLLLNYLKRQYPGLYFVSSTTKVLTDFQQLRRETEREEFRYVVPDFRLNKSFAERLPGQKALLRECQPQKSGRGLPGPPLHSAGRTAGLSFLKGNGKPRLHRGRGYPQNLSARRLFQLQDRGAGTGQRVDTGISALLHDKA